MEFCGTRVWEGAGSCQSILWGSVEPPCGKVLGAARTSKGMGESGSGGAESRLQGPSRAAVTRSTCWAESWLRASERPSHQETLGVQATFAEGPDMTQMQTQALRLLDVSALPSLTTAPAASPRWEKAGPGSVVGGRPGAPSPFPTTCLEELHSP